MHICLFPKMLPYLPIYPYIWIDECTAKELCPYLYIWLYSYPLIPIPIYPLMWIYAYLIDSYMLI